MFLSNYICFLTIKLYDMNKLIHFILFITPLIAYSQNQLMIPPTLSGTNIDLTLQTGTHQFYSGTNTNTYGANGNILAPTLLLNQGDFVNFTVNNTLSDTTTIHWHGLHVAPQNDGGPHTYIEPNTTWSPSFTIMDKAATYWYHPHLHKKTNEHVSKGIAGLLIVRDAEEMALNLPRDYGVDDFPLVLQTKDFDANKQIVVHSNNDETQMVNATINPYLEVPSQVVRFRVLNGSSMRVFNLGLSNGASFYQIASDGGLLSTPFSTTRVMLAPGERAELLIDFSGMNGQTVDLNSFASELPNGMYGAATPGMMSMLSLNGYNPNPLNGTDFKLLQFNIGTQTASPVTSIPTSLVTVTPIPEANAVKTRSFVMQPAQMGQNQLNGNFLINGASMDMSVINETVYLNDTEIWEIRNQSGISHPFHIHDVQFYILDRNGVAPPINEQGRKDVVFVKPQETVRFISVFEDFANDEIPYMYHCHLLTHEDEGMMGQFLVIDTTKGDGDPDAILELNEDDVRVFPNPSSNNLINLNISENFNVNNIQVFNTIGEEIIQYKSNEIQNQMKIKINQKGIYFLILKSNNKYFSKKILIK